MGEARPKDVEFKERLEEFLSFEMEDGELPFGAAVLFNPQGNRGCTGRFKKRIVENDLFFEYTIEDT